MLVELAIRDFAIIERLHLEFGPGLNILTGETGAGKSILVDALGLALGDRAHGEMVRTGAEEASVEAVFDGCTGPWSDFLEARGIGPDEEGKLYLQRRLTRTGRHQAHVNGGAVPLAVLGEVGARLVDIHGQHQHQTLLKVENHLEILDEYAGAAAGRRGFAALNQRLAGLEEKIRLAREQGRSRESKLDFLSFQLREIESAGLAPGEDEELERTRGLMQNAERIALLCHEALELLHEGETAAAGQVESALARLQEMSRHFPEASGLAGTLSECVSSIREAAASLEEWRRRAEYDPEEHNRVEERLALIDRLKRKHGGSVADILARAAELRAEVEALGGAEVRIEEWALEKAGILAEMAAKGAALGAARRKAAGRLEREVREQLGALGMPKASFQVRFAPRLAADGEVELDGRRYSPGPAGLEEAEFLLSANPGEEPKPLARVVSGGELSRIMLAIKTALARVDPVMTLIFDEIDTGIGGAVARTVGKAMKKLSAERQVICVTHLPQIASLSDAHYLVSKRPERGRSRVEVTLLKSDGKVEEIARMLAGEKVTRAAVEHARELMEG